MAPPDRSGGAFFARQGDPAYAAPCASAARSRIATILVILIIGLTAGPAVSLYGSPTVSPVTAALWASLPLPPWLRSEEHTSELQSLMRISYAGFCLKKQKKTNTKTQHI